MSRPRSKEPSWGSVHTWLVTDRGRARDQKCVGCDRQALDWAYQHTGTPLIDPTSGRLYSVNQADYAPMCRSCHFKLDVPRDPDWVQSNARNGRAGKGRKINYDLSEDQLGALSAGREKVRKMRKKCAECSLESSPSGIATHQKHSGHEGVETL